MAAEPLSEASESTSSATASGGRLGPDMGQAVRWVAGLIVAVLACGGIGWWVHWFRASPPSLEVVERLIASDRYAEAARGAGTVLASSPGDTRALFALARARAGLNDMQGLIEVLNRVPDWSLRKPEALFQVGQAWRVLNRGREEERAFLACIALDRGGPSYAIDARLELLKLYALEERREAFHKLVWETYDRLRAEDHLPILTMRMRIEFEQAKPEVNTLVLQALVESDPDDVYARAGLASARDRAGDLATAREHFAQALAAASDDLELRERYLDLLYRMGDLPALKAVLAKRAQTADRRPKTAKVLGFVAEKSSDLESAARSYAHAAAADPSDPEYLYRLSQVLSRQGKTVDAQTRAAEHARRSKARSDLRKAWNDFADAFESTPPRVTPELLLGMARACESCGWLREASAWYLETLRRDPDQAAARAGLERILSHSPRAEH